MPFRVWPQAARSSDKRLPASATTRKRPRAVLASQRRAQSLMPPRAEDAAARRTRRPAEPRHSSESSPPTQAEASRSRTFTAAARSRPAGAVVARLGAAVPLLEGVTIAGRPECPRAAPRPCRGGEADVWLRSCLPPRGLLLQRSIKTRPPARRPRSCFSARLLAQHRFAKPPTPPAACRPPERTEALAPRGDAGSTTATTPRPGRSPKLLAAKPDLLARRPHGRPPFRRGRREAAGEPGGGTAGGRGRA